MTTSTLNQTASLDTAFLSKWIQPQHLTTNAINNYREAFTSHPARIMRVSSFLREEIAARLSDFLINEANYFRVRHLYSLKNANVSEEQWLQSSDNDRLLHFSQMDGVKPNLKPSFNILFYTNFRKFFHDPRYAAFLSALTGIELDAPSSFVANSLEVGEYIRDHTDVHPQRHVRRLAFIVYMNPNWKPEYGGALHMIAHNKEQTVWEVEYNSFAFFDVLTHRGHSVAVINPEAGDEKRISFNGWFAGVEE